MTHAVSRDENRATIICTPAGTVALALEDTPGSPTMGRKPGGNCTGDWTHNVTMYDYVRVPAHLEPGEYVLGFR